MLLTGLVATGKKQNKTKQNTNKTTGESARIPVGKIMKLRAVQVLAITLRCVWPNNTSFGDDSHHTDCPSPG